MSAVPQLRPRESEDRTPAESEIRSAPPPAPPDNPLQLLRDAIDLLKSANGEIADHAQVAGLLAEAQAALQRATAIAAALSQCEGFVAASQFDQALEALDAILQTYPDDAALTARRREVEQQQKAFQTAIAVRAAIKEAKWYLDQDRVDLAIHFLKGKIQEFPDQPALLSGLDELEAQLPRWEQKRDVQAAMTRAASLEQMDQTQAALTILEEALQSYPGAEDLEHAAKRIRERMVEQDRRKKLTRRVETIGQKIALQSWAEAHSLLKDTWKEFPGAPELILLQYEADAGQRRSERDAFIAEARQYLADGDLDLADQVLQRGVEAMGPEPEFKGLRDKVDAERTYRENLRSAQVLFGRRQLADAERLLTELAVPSRPEAQTLLNAVRAARAATEEEDFCERGREKALELMQQEQWVQAIDLLRNLLTLFPGNPILERDLAVAENRLAQAVPEIPPAEQIEGSAEPEPRGPWVDDVPASLAPEPRLDQAEMAQPAPAAPVAPRVPFRLQRKVVVGGASLFLLVSATAAVLKLSHRPPPARPPAVQPAPLPQPVQPPAVPDPAKSDGAKKSATTAAPTQASPRQAPPTVTASTTKNSPNSQPPPLRPFVPVETKPQAPAQDPALPSAPSTGAQVSVAYSTLPPADVVQFVNTPIAPPVAAPRPAPAQTIPPKPEPSAPPVFHEAQAIQRTMPAYPNAARQSGIYGVVKMEAQIDESGNVKNVRVMSGNPFLAEAAKNAVRTWKFKPATLNNKPVPSNLVVQLSFGEDKR